MPLSVNVCPLQIKLPEFKSVLIATLALGLCNAINGLLGRLLELTYSITTSFKNAHGTAISKFRPVRTRLPEGVI